MGTLHFYQQCFAALQQEPIVLATVVQVTGSVPREVGATMAVGRGCHIIGTIGGGAGEAKVIDHATQVLETGTQQFVTIDLSGAPHRDTQGICGGMMQVWLERWQGDAAITLVQHILDLLRSGKAAWLVTPLKPERSPYLQLPSAPPTPASTPSLDAAAFTVPLLPPPTLLIVGAGHCAVPLARVAHLAGFRVVVQDDRPEFACVERFPTASAVLAQPIADAIASLKDVTPLYVALVTRGYTHDLAALQALLPQPVAYLGMIGSEKRVKRVYQDCIQTGTAPDLLRRIYAPIGLDIGALTPEEIAVSICAELIKVRRGGSGLPLSERMRQNVPKSI